MAVAAVQLFSRARAPDEPGRVDPITRLPNRQQFHADQAYFQGGKSTLVLFTLAEADDFNQILRALGHARSDEFIRAGVTRLLEIIGKGTRLYHVGPLSFTFCLPGLAEPDPPAIIERIARGFRAPIEIENIPIATRVAIGLKSYGGRGASPGEDLRAALSAAQDGRAGLRGWSWYDQESDAAHRRAFRLLTDLKSALDAEEQLSLHFQPKIDIRTGAVVSAEALLRWCHPQYGPVSPGEFVPLAETTALATPMTRWVIDAATAQMARWKADGVEVEVAINISPKNLEEPDFVEYLLFACTLRGIDRRLIELEITEGVSADTGPLILDRLTALRNLGFSVAIDDFGSGYCNMAYLTRLSARTLKIDQSLVRGVDPDGESGRLIAGIVQLGRDLGFRIVAEGIETEAEFQMLSALGCDIGQGWLFGKPMPAGEFARWHEDRKAETSAQPAVGGGFG